METSCPRCQERLQRTNGSVTCPHCEYVPPHGSD